LPQIDKEELSLKLLMCLDRSWYPKLTTISKSRDLSTVTTSAMFGMLREHEIKMQRLNEKESTEKKVKNIA